MKIELTEGLKAKLYDDAGVEVAVDRFALFFTPNARGGAVVEYQLEGTKSGLVTEVKNVQIPQKSNPIKDAALRVELSKSEVFKPRLVEKE